MARADEQALLRGASFSLPWQILSEAPTIAVLLSTPIAFFFGQLLAKSVYEFARASRRGISHTELV
jgi:hypothetical protein